MTIRRSWLCTAPAGVLVASVLAAAALANAQTGSPLKLPTSVELGRRVLEAVARNPAAFGGQAVPGATLHVAQQLRAPAGELVTVQRQVKGLPVVNERVSFLMRGGQAIATLGRLSPASSVITTRTFGRAAVVARLAQLSTLHGSPIRGQRVTDVMWATRTELLAAVDVQAISTAPFGLWRLIFDARDGRLVSVTPAMTEVSGNAYPTNPTLSKLQKVELVGLSQAADSGLSGPFAKARSCGYIDSSDTKLECKSLAKKDSTGDYTDEPQEPSVEDGFSEVQGYYHVDHVHRYMAQTFGFSRQGPTQQIEVNVNFHYLDANGSKHGISNAFYGDVNGDGVGDLTFGQGQRDFAYDGDVIYHEFTHSVVAETSKLTVDFDDLGLNMMPLALNEAFADFFSSVVSGDGVVGDYAGGSGGIRSLTGAASCPDSLAGESHSDGLIWGRTLWTIRSKLADKAAFDAAVYTTMVSLSMNPSMSEAAALLKKTVGTTDPNLANLVANEVSSRGLDDCTRIITLTSGVIRRGYMMQNFPGMNGTPAAMQYRIAVPQGATSLKVAVRARGQGGSGKNPVGAFIRVGQPVEYKIQGTVYDNVQPENTTEVTIGLNDAKQPLTPGQDYYILPLNTSKNEAMIEIHADVEVPPAIAPDAAPPAIPDAQTPVPATDVSPAQKLDGGVAPLTGVLPTTTTHSGCELGAQAPAANGHLLSGLALLLGLLLVIRRRRG